MRTGVRVAVWGWGGASVRVAPEPVGPEPRTSLGCAFLSRPPAQLRSWATRCGATCPDSAVEPPPRPAQAPEPGHLRARGRCGSSALQRWRSSQPCAGLPSQVSMLPRGRAGGRLAAPRPPATHTDPATGTYRVRLRRRERVSPGVHGASGPARPAAAPHSTAQKMDAGGWALPARPAPGAGHWPQPGREEVGQTLCPVGRCSSGLAAPWTRPWEGSGGTRGHPRRPRAPQTSPSGQRPPPPPSPGKTAQNLRKDNPVRGLPPEPRHSEPGLGPQKGSRVPDPDSRPHANPAHWREAGFRESQVQF